jgi:uroporphyrinogen-III synthase
VNGVLVGCRVLVTRERPGELAALLESKGAIAVHVPLIEVVDPIDGGAALQHELDRLADFDWVVVTSAAGAERIAGAVRRTPSVRLAAVGSATARVLADTAGRPVDLVPSSQRADVLLEELCTSVTSPQRILVAQADRAADTLAVGLRDAGHEVTAVVAYRTLLRTPPPGVIEGADALMLASGSAAQSWFDALGDVVPPIVVSIGPATTSVATRLGLKVTATSTDHSLDGLVRTLERILATWGPGVGPVDMAQSTTPTNQAK